MALRYRVKWNWKIQIINHSKFTITLLKVSSTSYVWRQCINVRPRCQSRIWPPLSNVLTLSSRSERQLNGSMHFWRERTMKGKGGMTVAERWRYIGRRYHRRDFSVSGSNNVSGCRLYGVRPGTGECPVGSSDDARSPGATPVRTYISILTNHYYMPGEPRWAESTTNAHVAYLDQVYQQFTGARAL